MVRQGLGFLHFIRFLASSFLALSPFDRRHNLAIHPLLHLKKTTHSSNTLIFGPYLQQGQQQSFGERRYFATFGHIL
jgi:hypothetical protein